MLRILHQDLMQFLSEEIRVLKVHQPVLPIELLRNNGQASVNQIAKAIFDRDPTHIEYFSEIVKNMAGRVLTKNRGITEKQGDCYHLIGA